MAAKNNLIKPQSYETVTVMVKDVLDSTESAERVRRDGTKFTVEFPYILQIAEKSTKNIITEEPSEADINPDKFDNKFYTNNSGYTAFSRNQNLFATYCILLKKKELQHDIKAEFDVNSLIGKEFEAVIAEYTDSKTNKTNIFIDWIKTFKANDMAVPDKNTARSNQPTSTGSTKSNVVVDPDDLPF